MSPQPAVTVLISSFNDVDDLPGSVDSILAQTFTDFELLVVDDGSSDDTPRYLAGVKDPRLVILRNDSNGGLTWSLHRGVEQSKGRYIARLDAGDRAHPKRLEKQIAFLEHHTDIGILGSACLHVDDQGRLIKLLSFPSTDLEIRWNHLIQNPFGHSAVVIRSSTLREHGLNYDVAFHTTQDYDLWSRLLAHTKGANLVARLTTLGHRHDGITQKHRQLQLANHTAIALRNIHDLLPEFTISSTDAASIQRLLGAGFQSVPELDGRRLPLANLYLDLFEAFTRSPSCPPRHDQLRRQVAIQAARIGLRPPWPGRAMTLTRRIWTLDAGFPLHFLFHLVAAFGRYAKANPHADGVKVPSS